MTYPKVDIYYWIKFFISLAKFFHMKCTATFLTTCLCFLSFSHVKAQNLQGDFENWRTVSSGLPLTQFEVPDGWFGADSLLFHYAPLLPGSTPLVAMYKDADAHTGSYAVKLVSQNVGADIGVVPGLLSNAEPFIDLATFDPNNILGSLIFVGGTTVNNRVSEVKAWVKYDPQGSDNALVHVMALNNLDAPVGEGTLLLSNAHNTYTEISVPVTYANSTVVPSKIIVNFYSSNLVSASKGTEAETPTAGTTLFVDDVEAVILTDVNDVVHTTQSLRLFPNPATEVLHLSTAHTGTQKCIITDVSGRTVMQADFTEKTTLQIGQLPSGTYFYQIINHEGIQMHKGKFQVAK
jgi:hypothetical protein